MSIENKSKSEHGNNGIQSIDQMIDALVGRDYIVSYQRKIRVADPDYEEKQFYFQFLIEFYDHELWILHHTTSIRDRIAEQQWHSEHIKRIIPNVAKAYVVVPDGLTEREARAASNYNEKIVNKKIFSALDGVVTFEQIYGLIEQKATSLMELGKAKARLGLHFEEKLVDSLNSEQNLRKWKEKNSMAVGYLYSLYSDVLSALNVDSYEVDKIVATTNIPKLPSGGSPKSDVLIEVYKNDGGVAEYTFSCKRSSSDRVTVHEYTAEAFSKVLNPNDYRLYELLSVFQSLGGVKSMPQELAIELETRLKVYNKKLTEWVLAGIGGEGDPNTQWVSHIIVLNDVTNTYKISTVEEYINECYENNVIGQLGTLFQWTYPSGGKGKRIQLKMKVL